MSMTGIHDNSEDVPSSHHISPLTKRRLCCGSRSKTNEGFVKRRGNASRATSVQPITCLAITDKHDSVVSGTVGGLLMFWVDYNCIRVVKAHSVSSEWMID